MVNLNKLNNKSNAKKKGWEMNLLAAKGGKLYPHNRSELFVIIDNKKFHIFATY
jgi:hypothetical protein